MELTKQKKVAIQGIEGSFHHQVALANFGSNIELDQCMTFKELAKNVEVEKVDVGVMALENSIAGSIIPNYALLDKHNLQIIGEYYLRINMNLMALEGQSIEEINEVHSHPIALLQCAKFFSKYPHIKLVESVDTAETAYRIKKNNIKGMAAVASSLAAEMFDLEVLASNIHSQKNNTTRFVLVTSKNKKSNPNQVDKISLKFQIEDKLGGLATILNIMNDHRLNLTKIQSMPVVENPWHYSFFVDFTFEDYEKYQKAMEILKMLTSEFKILGQYINGRQI